MLTHRRLACFVVFLFTFALSSLSGRGQEAPAAFSSILSFPEDLEKHVGKKANKLAQGLTRSTEKYLLKLRKKELNMQKKVARKDSVAAKEIFGDVKSKYQSFIQRLKTPGSEQNSQQNDYLAHVDSMKTALGFIISQRSKLNNNPLPFKMVESLKNYSDIQEKFNGVRDVQQFLSDRHSLFESAITKYGLTKSLLKYKKELFYYRGKVREYKAILKDPLKAESKILQYVRNSPAFKNFFNKHSELASLFRLPGDAPVDVANLQGLQTREMLMQTLEQRFGGGLNMQQYLQANMVDSRTLISTIKEKINATGSGSTDSDMPDFTQNSEKTKAFAKRLVLGSSLNTVKGRSYFPVTTDIGLSVGYKLNSKSVAGLGASYKMGWGKDFKHIAISHQGVGLRSFVDYRLKRSFWLTGGFEMNYLSSFHSVVELKDYSAWQQSGLLGVSKKISLRSKLLKKSQVQLLWDFLSYRQVPQTSPFIYRIGYQF